MELLTKDYNLVEAHPVSGEACKLWWPLQLCWWEHKLLAGSSKQDRL